MVKVFELYNQSNRDYQLSAIIMQILTILSEIDLLVFGKNDFQQLLSQINDAFLTFRTELIIFAP
ncbi:MAG: hypothetical protein J5I59_03380 [Saprospiraceae bacterium]|nr:hypothetical protein [Saprospiraceae bacterium]